MPAGAQSASRTPIVANRQQGPNNRPETDLPPRRPTPDTSPLMIYFNKRRYFSTRVALGYLTRLRKRMAISGFQQDDELLQAVQRRNGHARAARCGALSGVRRYGRRAATQHPSVNSETTAPIRGHHNAFLGEWLDNHYPSVAAYRSASVV